jgi:hypothetical protein
MAPRKKVSGATPAKPKGPTAAQLAAQAAEQQRLEDELAARNAGNDAGDGQGAPQREIAGVELTHPGGGIIIVDPTAVTHVQPALSQVLHSDPKKAAMGEMENGLVTEIGTIGGLVIRVMEDVEAVATACGL